MVPPKPKSPTKFVPITPLDSTTQEQLDAEPVDAHYNRLYSCKHFRNRVLRIQQLCAENSIDAVLILTGKFALFLLFPIQSSIAETTAK